MHDPEIILARTAWFIDMAVLNPAGLAYGPIHTAFKERYNFLMYPTKPEEFDSAKGITYRSGTFEFQGALIDIAMYLYNNGWIVDTRVSTDASDAFSQDLIYWLSTQFGFHGKEAVNRIVHESQIGFRSDVGLSRINKDLQRFAKVVAGALKDHSIEPWAIMFQGDGTPTNPPFTFERRVDVPFKEKKYFSKAPFPTKVHVRLINEFEKIFS